MEFDEKLRLFFLCDLCVFPRVLCVQKDSGVAEQHTCHSREGRAGMTSESYCDTWITSRTTG